MPVFGCDFYAEGEGEEVSYCGEDGAAVGDGKGSVLFVLKKEERVINCLVRLGGVRSFSTY